MTKKDLIKFIEKTNYEDIKEANITYITEDGEEIINTIIDSTKYKKNNVILKNEKEGGIKC